MTRLTQAAKLLNSLELAILKRDAMRQENHLNIKISSPSGEGKELRLHIGPHDPHSLNIAEAILQNLIAQEEEIREELKQLGIIVN